MMSVPPITPDMNTDDLDMYHPPDFSIVNFFIFVMSM